MVDGEHPRVRLVAEHVGREQRRPEQHDHVEGRHGADRQSGRNVVGSTDRQQVAREQHESRGDHLGDVEPEADELERPRQSDTRRTGRTDCGTSAPVRVPAMHSNSPSSGTATVAAMPMRSARVRERDLCSTRAWLRRADAVTSKALPSGVAPSGAFKLMAGGLPGLRRYCIQTRHERVSWRGVRAPQARYEQHRLERDHARHLARPGGAVDEQDRHLLTRKPERIAR